MFWDNTNGRLGLGTSTPFWGLHYNTNGALNVGMFSSFGNTNTFESLLYLLRGRGTQSVPSAILSGDNLGSLRLAGQYSSTVGQYTTGAKIEGVATENWSASANGTYLGFHTTAIGSNSILERMRINSNGNLIINTTTDGGFKFDVNGTARVSGQISSGITGTNGSIGLRRTSDGSIVGSFYTDAAQTIVKEHTGTGGVLLNGFDTTSLKWVGSSSQPRVGIGFNGTINATCHIKGAFATSATSSLLIENSAGTAAMRVRDDLVILLPNLPTTSAGLPTGAIYNNLGILTIV